MATDRFFPFELAIIISLFYTAFDDTIRIPKTVCANFAIDRRCYPAKFPVINIFPLAFDLAQTFLCEVRLDIFEMGINNFSLIFLQRCTRITVLAATTFALMQVAYEFGFYHIVTDQYIFNCNHGDSFMQIYATRST